MKLDHLLGAALALALTATGASAESWPGEKAVQLIVPSKPGGCRDVMACIFSDYLARETGGDVVVVNQPDGGGSIANNSVLTAEPDGHTTLFNQTGMLVAWHTGRRDVAVSDFTTIDVAQSHPPQVFAVAPDPPWSTLKENVEDARANPGQRSVAVSLDGATHFIAGIIVQNENVDLRQLEASAEVDKVAAIQGGHIDLGNLGAGSARQYQQSGDMKVLCLIAEERHPNYPVFETCIEQGVDVNWLAPLVLWVSKDMDAALVAQINAATAGMATDEKTQEQLADSTFVHLDVAAEQALMEAENAKIGDLAKALGLSAR